MPPQSTRGSKHRAAAGRLGRAELLLGLAVAVMATGVGWALYARSSAAVTERRALRARLPRLERPEEYVSSNRCRACHPAEHASWHRTYHRTMTQVAVPESVIGQFNDATVRSAGLEYRVYRRGNQFWAEMPDPEEMMYVVQGGKPTPLEDIPRVHRQVVMTTGSHHYQTYWVTGDERYGRLLQTLPLIYLVKDQRWIPREAAFMLAPGAERMITQWNHHCINCHSTGGNPGLTGSGPAARLETEVAELGISCEACHGPGEEHVRLNEDPLRRYRLHLTGADDPSIVNPAKVSPERSNQICGQCHGVYIRTGRYGMAYARRGVLYRPGQELHQTRYYIQYPRGELADRQDELRNNPEFFRERWWEDGTILAAGREYTALSVSGCATRGEMTCLSCHSMHDSDPVDQLKPTMRTSAACTQCHDESQYTESVEQHTFHASGSSGSNCLNCHMPHTNYALLGAIRTHQIQSPQVASSVQHGVPNACNLCHLDKTLEWVQTHLSQWYDQETVPLEYQHRTTSAVVLWLLKGHAAQRAIAAWHIGWEPAQQASGVHWPAPLVAQLLADPYGVVRYIAQRSLGTLPGFDRFTFDFLGTESERRAKVREAVRLWLQDQQTSPRTADRAVLIGNDGQLMQSQLESLLQQRDDRPVTIKE